MRITVFGANLLLGTRIVHLCIHQGISVTAFARNIDQFIDEDNRTKDLLAVKGYVLDTKDVAKGLKNADAVIVLFNNTSFEPSDKSRSIGIKNIIAQMQLNNIRRIVVLGGMGILQNQEGEFLLDTPEFPAELIPMAKEQLLAYNYLSNSGLDWTYYCPESIIEQDETGLFITNMEELPSTNNHYIYAGDLALSMIQSIKKNAFIHARVGISNI